MKTRQLGTTDLHLTPIGLGTWGMGGGSYEYGWGDQDDADSINTIHHALDAGINWIDTAAGYGLGRSEQIIGRALQGLSSPPLVFTKCSMVWNQEGKFTPILKEASIRQEIEGSLRRLQVEVIDLYQIHQPEPTADIEEGLRTLSALQQEGKVRYIGVSNFNLNQLKRAQKVAKIDSVQPPYSVIRSEIEETILPFCQEHRIGVIVYSPMMSGLLSGKMSRERVQHLPHDDWRKHSPDFQEPRFSQYLKVVEYKRSLGKRYRRSPGEVAIAWTLHHPAVTGAIVGARRSEQIRELVGAGTFRLNATEVDELTQFVRELG